MECVGGGYPSGVRVWEVLELGAAWGSSLLKISAEAKRDTGETFFVGKIQQPLFGRG